MSDNSEKLDRDMGMPGRMEPSSIGLMDSHVPIHSRRLPDTPKPHTPKYEGSDRRQRYRLRKDIKILVEFKEVYQSSQVGTVKNLTRTGIFFEAFGEYQPGMTTDVVFPYDPAEPSLERPQQAEVVRVKQIQGSLKKGVAIKLLSVFRKP